ncbi:MULTISPECIES: hypothetical protein [Streptomyces]|uniref:Integral membrane protein n=2 Tax=Streptomyces TaxID=1883 RepID=A0A100Y489_9ACTN|nr:MULTISPECIES: hypothetical protein [Streptomyces]KUH37376.1 hypothetical protein ATE80_18585 [Streptomyces kanasensis]UUS31627.1 hypothetical protein NRO40_12820 [Streptomyces changanensis]
MVRLAGPGPALRLARATVFAAVCVVTAALGHSLAAGEPLPLDVLAGAMAVTTALAWWPAGAERRGALRITGTTVGAQLALHTAFSFAPSSHGGGHHQQTTGVALPPSVCMGGATDPVAQAVWQAHTAAPVAAPGPESPVEYAVRLLTHGSWLMFFAHVLAALLCGLWMWRGEAGFSAIARSVHCALFVPLRLALAGFTPAMPVRLPRAAAAFVRPRRLLDALLRHAVSRRGPPRGCPVPC